jgi:acetyltransferase-like isoleucine patch superfamily enzyme
MKISIINYRVQQRLKRHSLIDHVKGFWVSRKFTESGIVVVSGGFPFPKVLNNGGKIYVENIQLYSGVRIEVGNGAVLKIGNGTYINRNTLIITNNLVEIGKNCKIAWDVVIMDSDLHALPGREIENKPVIIEDEVWIGCRSIILKGVHIGKSAIIAAGSVVTKDIPAGVVVGGVPTRILQQPVTVKGRS